MKAKAALTPEMEAVIATVREIMKLNKERKASSVTVAQLKSIWTAHESLFRTMRRFAAADIAKVRDHFKIKTIWQVK